MSDGGSASGFAVIVGEPGVLSVEGDVDEVDGGLVVNFDDDKGGPVAIPLQGVVPTDQFGVM